MKSQVVFSREPRPALPTNVFFCVVDIFHVVSVAFPGGERLVADCARGDILLVLLLEKKETLRKLHDNSDYRPITSRNFHSESKLCFFKLPVFTLGVLTMCFT